LEEVWGGGKEKILGNLLGMRCAGGLGDGWCTELAWFDLEKARTKDNRKKKRGKLLKVG